MRQFISPLILATVFACATELHANVLEQSLNTTASTHEMGKKSQLLVDKLAQQQQQLLEKYQQLLRKSEYQKAYNQELAKLKLEQALNIETLKKQINEVQLTKQQLLPLLRTMTQTLEQFIRLDLPFKRQQRLVAVDKLKTLIASSSEPLSKKFRRTMELYQAENDHNYDLEVYPDSIRVNGENLSVQVLRLGRIALYAQTLDGQVSAMWNKTLNHWHTLSHDYELPLRKAMRIAGKKAAPELLQLPYFTQLEPLSQHEENK